MPITDVLIQLSSYPVITARQCIAQAVEFSELLGARISTLTFELDIQMPKNPLAMTFMDVPGMIASEEAKGISNTIALRDVVEELASQRGLPVEHLVTKCHWTEIPDAVTDYARLRDLTIVPIAEPVALQQSIAEYVIFGSGRPVLILPGAPNVTRPIRLDTIGIAWDFGRAAARALSDAIPLLQRAREVRVVTVKNERAFETRLNSSDLARHLALHGVKVTVDEEDAKGRPVGDVLNEYVSNHSLDVLVMGAYGHSRIRDLLLGGATKSIVSSPPLPVFLSH